MKSRGQTRLVTPARVRLIGKLPLADGEVQGRLTGGVGGVQVTTGRQQLVGDGGVAGPGRPRMEQGGLRTGLGLHLGPQTGPVGEEQADRFRRMAGHGDVQGGLPEVGATEGIDVRAVAEQQFHQSDVLMDGGEMERGVAIGADVIGIAPLVISNSATAG